MTRKKYNPGEPVVFRMSKHSPRPGPRAREVHPSRGGEDYAYVVDKFWVIEQVRTDGKLLLRTRRGKAHVIDSGDPSLRRLRWWERLFRRGRFPSLQSIPTAGEPG